MSIINFGAGPLGKSEREKGEIRMQSCEEYVKRIWPNDSEEERSIRLEAVYTLSESFFDEILPFNIKMILSPSVN